MSFKASAPPCVLTINAGSSSIRFAVYEPGETLFLRRIDGKIDHVDSRVASGVGHGATAVDLLLDRLEAQPLFASVRAVGHRVVHGMKYFRAGASHAAAAGGTAPAHSLRP